jgi:hypothetical protein
MPFNLPKNPMKNENLYLIAVYSNQLRYNSRLKLFNEFVSYAQSCGAIVIPVEAAFADRPFVVTDSSNPNHVQVRTKQEIWNKENLINIGLRHLPHDWQYVAWVDADVMFARPDWVKETIHQLHHYDIVQMFSETIDVDDRYIQVTSNGSIPMKGMAYQYKQTGKILTAYGKHTGHCGYAWAATRKAIDTIDGLIDFSIIGSGDFQMACAFMQTIESSINLKWSEGYKQTLRQWGDRAALLKKNVGYVDGLLMHHWHGKKSDRGYMTRGRILVDNQFDPTKDLKYDWQGLYYLVDDGTERYINLRDDMRAYFRSRNEDGSNY